jgi:hypothetical protein
MKNEVPVLIRFKLPTWKCEPEILFPQSGKPNRF